MDAALVPHSLRKFLPILTHSPALSLRLSVCACVRVTLGREACGNCKAMKSYYNAMFAQLNSGGGGGNKPLVLDVMLNCDKDMSYSQYMGEENGG